MKEDRFQLGDLVFAKCAKTKPWPAKIIEKFNQSTYKVDFYNHNSFGIVALNDLQRLTVQSIEGYKKVYEERKNKDEMLIMDGIAAAEADFNQRMTIENAQIQTWKEGIPTRAQQKRLKQLLKPLIDRPILKPSKNRHTLAPKMSKAMQAKQKKAEKQQEGTKQRLTRNSLRNFDKKQTVLTVTQTSQRLSSKEKPQKSRKGKVKDTQEEMKVQEPQINIHLAPDTDLQRRQAEGVSPTQHLSSDDQPQLNIDYPIPSTLPEQRGTEVKTSDKLSEKAQQVKEISEDGQAKSGKNEVNSDKMVDEGVKGNDEYKPNQSKQKQSMDLQQLVEKSYGSGCGSVKKQILVLDQQVTFIKNNLEKDSESEAQSNGHPSKSLSLKLKDISPIQSMPAPTQNISQMAIEKDAEQVKEKSSFQALAKLNPSAQNESSQQQSSIKKSQVQDSYLFIVPQAVIEQTGVFASETPKELQQLKAFQKKYANYDLQPDDYVSLALRMPILKKQIQEVKSNILVIYMRRCLIKLRRFVKSQPENSENMKIKMWQKQLFLAILGNKTIATQDIVILSCMDLMMIFMYIFECSQHEHKKQCLPQYIMVLDRLSDHMRYMDQQADKKHLFRTLEQGPSLYQQGVKWFRERHNEKD